MAASIYATPPPDLIGEDTGLSDSSNLSSTTSPGADGLEGVHHHQDRGQSFDPAGKLNKGDQNSIQILN